MRKNLRVISRGAVLISAALAAGGALLTGCGPATDPVRVVAVTAATAEQPQPVLRAAGLDVVRRAAESDHGSFTLLVSGDPEAAAELDLTARREAGTRSEVEHGPQREEKITASVSKAAELVAAVAAHGGAPSLLQTISDGARGVPGTFLVLDSGVSTAAPLDLRTLGWSADPRIVADDLRTRGYLPQLAGWDVVFLGLGEVAGDQPPLEVPQQRWLASLWTEICRAAGARSCTVDPGSLLPAPAPASTRRSPPVPIPAPHTATFADGTVEIAIPDARLGFGPGSADLAPGVELALLPVLDAVAAVGGRCRVAVTGFVAYWGSESYRAGLSQARADAVAGWLADHGVRESDITAVGAGAADGPEASQTAGRFDEAKVAAGGIRRVVVSIRPAS